MIWTKNKRCFTCPFGVVRYQLGGWWMPIYRPSVGFLVSVPGFEVWGLRKARDARRVVERYHEHKTRERELAVSARKLYRVLNARRGSAFVHDRVIKVFSSFEFRRPFVTWRHDRLWLHSSVGAMGIPISDDRMRACIDIAMRPQRYQYHCSECVFLGQSGDWDLFACLLEPFRPAFVARQGFSTEFDGPLFDEARQRAKKMGVI